MDFLSAPGFLFPILINESSLSKGFLLNIISKLRLVVWAILCEYPEAVNVMGPECGSWGLPARGTSKRNFMNYCGALHLAFVANADKTVSRTHDWI